MNKNTSSSAWFGLILFAGIALLSLWLSTPRPSAFPPESADRKPAFSPAKGSFKSRQKQRTIPRPSPFAAGKVRMNFTQLKLSSVQFSQANFGKSRAEDLWILPAGTELLAVIDRECAGRPSMVAQMTQDSFSHRLADPRVNRPALKTQAFGFRTEREMTGDELAAIAEADPCLIGVAEDGRVAMDTLYADPSAGQQAHLTNLQAGETENFFFQSSLVPTRPVVIAVVDTGVDYKHVDLLNNMWSDSQGRHGYDFVNEDNDPMDDNFHGTHVSGLAAAVGGNDMGGAGVMPAKIQIMAVKVLDDQGNGSYSDVANGIYWAVEKGADLINLSLSGPGENAGVADALAFAANHGVPVFISAGNNGSELTDSNFRTPTSFGRDIQGVITVGAIDAVTSELSNFSNYSPEFVEIAAPGSNGIYSTLPDNTFGEREGTSMSTPIAAGAAALTISALKAKNYPFTAAEIENILRESALSNPALGDFVSNGKQINLIRLRDHLLRNYLVQSDGGLNDEE